MKKILLMSGRGRTQSPIVNLLDFDVNNTIIGNGTLSNDIGANWTVVRNSVANYKNTSNILVAVAAHFARIQDSKMLIESAAINIAPDTEDVNLWTTNLNVTIVANDITAPDENTTADKIIDTAIDGIHRVRAIVPDTLSDTYYEISCYAKAGTIDYVQLGMNGTADSAMASIVFDVKNGAIGEYILSSNGGIQSSRIEALPNGWYKCTLIGKVLSLANRVIAVMAPLLTGNVALSSQITYLGDTTGTLYVWGTNVKLVDSSYIKDANTREADVITITVPLGATKAETWIDGVSDGGQAVTPGATFTMLNGTTKIIMN